MRNLRPVFKDHPSEPNTKSNLLVGIKRVPFLGWRGLHENLNPKTGNKGLLWVLDEP